MSRKKKVKWAAREANTTDFYECDCHAEGLTISTFEEEESIILSLWSRGRSRKGTLPWKVRLKAIKDLLFNGCLDWDEVIINYKTAKKLAKDLLKKVGQK